MVAVLAGSKGTKRKSLGEIGLIAVLETARPDLI
jgi:hypothetical protein